LPPGWVSWRRIIDVIEAACGEAAT
jgi:hypothetical protein